MPSGHDRRRGLSRAPEGGWGWLVVAVSSVTSIVHSGATISTSAVMYTDLIEAFAVSTATAGIPGMAVLFGTHIAGVFVGQITGSRISPVSGEATVGT